MIKEKSDFFQNTKFYSIFNIYNSADCQFSKFVWIANSMPPCTVTYCANDDDDGGDVCGDVSGECFVTLNKKDETKINQLTLVHD